MAADSISDSIDDSINGRAHSLVRVVANAFRFIRRITGDDAYDIYLHHHTQDHPDQQPLSRRAFYVADQQRKWSGIKRCC
jgi:uncharacterized short protein YbdD (DUF466 family)